MEAGDVLNCTFVDEKTVECFGERFSLEEGLLKASNGLFWVYLCLYIVLVLFAGVFVCVCVCVCVCVHVCMCALFSICAYLKNPCIL